MFFGSPAKGMVGASNGGAVIRNCSALCQQAQQVYLQVQYEPVLERYGQV